MSQWSLEFEPKADKDLARLDNVSRRRIIEKLDWLLENFDSLFPAPLHNEKKIKFCFPSFTRRGEGR